MLGTVLIILCPILMLVLAVWADNPFKKTEHHETPEETASSEGNENQSSNIS